MPLAPDGYGFLIAGVVAYSCWLPLVQRSWFSWHVILCTVGYLPIMAEAIMLFTGDELFLRQLSRNVKNKIHGNLILWGTIILVAGDIVIIYRTTEHFDTPHGLTGFISMVLVLISLPIGIAAHYTQKISHIIKPIWVKFIHNVVGILGYGIGIISLGYGFYTHWWIYYTDEGSRLAAVLATAIATIWTLNGSFVSCYNQLKSIFS